MATELVQRLLGRVLFSFDPANDAASLQDFRVQQRLPASWAIARSSDADIRRFTDFFHYPGHTESGLMLHTNQLFVLNRDLAWRATFVNESWTAADMRIWLPRVENPGVLGWAIMNPAKLVIVGFAALRASLALIAVAFLSRSGTASL